MEPVSPWLAIETLCGKLAKLLLEQGVPHEPVALPQAAEEATDVWIRTYLCGPDEIVYPTDPLILRGLLARFQYVSTLAAAYNARGMPAPEGPAMNLLRVLLIDLWYRHFRAEWLAPTAPASEPPKP